MIRKFWLVNALGNEYHFTDKNSKIFLNQPEGLGFQKSYSVQKVGNSELVTSQQFTLTNITGELLFYANSNGTRYNDYQQFIQFAKYKPLEFHYLTPNDIKSYHCDVLFVQADKSEVSTDGILHVPVTFHRLTEWITDESTTYTLDNSLIGDGKYYDLVRDYTYAGTGLSGTPIYNNGTDDVGMTVIIEGECTNPQFTLTQNGSVYGVCKINGTYDYILIDSVEMTEEIYAEYQGSVITNPEQYQDFTVRNGAAYLTWIKLKVGESIFAFTCGNILTFTGNVKVRVKESYATV